MHGKLFAVGMALMVGCAAPIAINDACQVHIEQQQRQADARAADQMALAHELPGTPPDVAAAFVNLLAEGGGDAVTEGCLLFSDQAARQFALSHHATTCPDAMQALRSQVTDPAAYADDLAVPGTAWTEAGTSATLDGCAMVWSGLFTDAPIEAPGPLLGLLTLTRLDGYGWQIVHYEPC